MKQYTRKLSTLFAFFLALTCPTMRAQVQNMIVYKANGTAVRFEVESIDSVAFEQIPK